MYYIRETASSQNPFKNLRGVVSQKSLSINRLQSPKISNVGNRFVQNKKLFSLLDVNDKITNSRGTSLPFQYTRYSSGELNKIFNNTLNPSSQYRKGRNRKDNLPKIKTESDFDKAEAEEKKNSNQPAEQNPTPPEETPRIVATSPQANLRSDLETIQVEKPTQREQTEKEPKTKPKIQETIKNTLTTPSNTIQPKRSSKNKFKILNSITDASNNGKEDTFMPRGFRKYEHILKNPKLIINQGVNADLAKRLPTLNLKEIRRKNHESDIFFLKSQGDGYSKKPLSSFDHSYSDIFFLKADSRSKCKSGEKYLDNPKLKNHYTALNSSNSQWAARLGVPSSMGHESVKWNILNPSDKGQSKTMTDIKEEYGPNAAHLHKGLTEFIDLTRVSAPNPNKTYFESYNKTHNCFHKTHEVCSTYYDIHGQYKNLCDKPFVKPPLIS